MANIRATHPPSLLQQAKECESKGCIFCLPDRRAERHLARYFPNMVTTVLTRDFVSRQAVESAWTRMYGNHRCVACHIREVSCMATTGAWHEAPSVVTHRSLDYLCKPLARVPPFTPLLHTTPPSPPWQLPRSPRRHHLRLRRDDILVERRGLFPHIHLPHQCDTTLGLPFVLFLLFDSPLALLLI